MRNASKNWLNQIPSKLPPTYVQRTLARLLPPANEIAKMGRDDLVKLMAKKMELAELIEQNPVRFFEPAPCGGQRKFMTESDPKIQGRYFFAANKTGKTTGGAIACGEFAEGKPLWGLDSRLEPNPLLTPRVKRLCFFSEDFATHEENIIPTYVSWMKSYVYDIVKGSSGNYSRIICKNGSMIYLRTYDQGYEKAEGKDYDLVWCDEPPPRDMYTAIFRGLVASKGILIITATLLSEAWLYDEVKLPHIRVYDATMFDNPWLDDEGRNNYISMLTDEERAIRIYGKPSTLAGSIYPMFRATQPSPFIIPQTEPPWDALRDKPWPIVLTVDPHERKPIYCLWGYITPDDSILWFDWKLIPSDSIKGVFAKLSEVEKTHKAPTSLVILDPNRGIQRQIDGKSWQSAFEEHEYPVLLGNDDMAHGHFVVREFFAEPIKMFFMEACQGKNGPIYSLERYTWEDWARGQRFERAVKEKPQEKYKDFPDVIRYAAVALYDGQISHSLLSQENLDIDLIGESARSFGNPYTH